MASRFFPRYRIKDNSINYLLHGHSLYLIQKRHFWVFWETVDGTNDRYAAELIIGAINKPDLYIVRNEVNNDKS